MLNCKDISYLSSKKLDGKLTIMERIGFIFHLSMCRLCRHYARDLKMLHNMLKKAGDKGQLMLSDSAKLSAHSRQRIKKILQQALAGKD